MALFLAIVGATFEVRDAFARMLATYPVGSGPYARLEGLEQLSTSFRRIMAFSRSRSFISG